MQHPNRHSALTISALALAASFLPCAAVWGQASPQAAPQSVPQSVPQAASQVEAGTEAQPTQVEVKGHSLQIPEGPHCTYTAVDKLPVDMKGGLATVKGQVNGRKSTMLVDTGSKFSELGEKEAEKMGLTLLHTDRTETDANGKETFIYAVKVSTFGFGRYGWRGMQMAVSQEPDRAGFAVGADVLFNAYNRDVEFSLARKEIKIFLPKDCSDAFLGYWDENASEIPLVDVAPNDPRQLVTVQVDGHPMTALIDSGSPHTIIDLEAAKRIGIDPHEASVSKIQADGSVHRHAREYPVSVQSFVIGDETVNRPRIAVADLWGWTEEPVHSELQSGMRMSSMSPNAIDHNIFSSTFRPRNPNATPFSRPDMILGADFLQSHRVLLAMSQQRMYFSYTGGKVFGGTATVLPTPQS